MPREHHDSALRILKESKDGLTGRLLSTQQLRGYEYFKPVNNIGGFSFTKAVLISNDETGNYGETQFKIDLAGKNYLKMLRKPFSRLFGIFTPDKSDFIFSQSGNLIGIMVNRNYCIAIRDFTIVESLNINPYSKQKAEETKTMLSKSIKQLPTTFR